MQISKLFLRTGVHLALFFAVSGVAISSAQAGHDGDEQDSKAAPKAALATPASKYLEKSNPSYSILRSFISPQEPTENHLKAYQTLKEILKDERIIFPNAAYFQNVFAAQEDGIEIKTRDDLFTYGDTKSWLKNQAPTQAQVKAASTLKQILKDDRLISPNEIYFQNVFAAQEAGIEIKTRDDLFTYGDTKSWLKDKAPTQAEFNAGKVLKQILKDNRLISPNATYFQNVLAAQETGIELKTPDDLFTYGDTKSWLGDKAPTQAQFKAGSTLKEILKDNRLISPNETYFQAVLAAQEVGIELKTTRNLFDYSDVKGILGASPTPLQFQAYTELKPKNSYRNPYKDEINKLVAEKSAGK
jgi:hypothetical protein